MNKKLSAIIATLTISIGGVLYGLQEALEDPTLCEQLITECEQEFDSGTLTPKRAMVCSYIQKNDTPCPAELTPELALKVAKLENIKTDGRSVVFYNDAEFNSKKDEIRGKFTGQELRVTMSEFLPAQGTLALEADRLIRENPDCIIPIIKGSTKDNVFYNLLNNNC